MFEFISVRFGYSQWVHANKKSLKVGQGTAILLEMYSHFPTYDNRFDFIYSAMGMEINHPRIKANAH